MLYGVQSTFNCQLCLSSQPLKNAAIFKPKDRDSREGRKKPFIFKSFSKLMIQKVFPFLDIFLCAAEFKQIQKRGLVDLLFVVQEMIFSRCCFGCQQRAFLKRSSTHKKVFTLKVQKRKENEWNVKFGLIVARKKPCLFQRYIQNSKNFKCL